MARLHAASSHAKSFPQAQDCLQTLHDLQLSEGRVECCRRAHAIPGEVYRPSDQVSLMQVRSIGKRECSNLFKLGDELIQFGELHQLLGASVADMLPVNPSVLLSDDAKRLARATGSLARQDSMADGSSYETANAEMAGLAAPKSFEGLMNSPWKVSTHGSSDIRISDVNEGHTSS